MPTPSIPTPEPPRDWGTIAQWRRDRITELEYKLNGLITWLTLVILLLSLGLMCVATQVLAHEMEKDMTPEEQRIVQFLQLWQRPAGNFQGIEHRMKGCCYIAGPSQDCFSVAEVRRVNGHREVFPQTSDPRYMHWYDADKTGVSEDIQPDPRESPDGRSYVCIQGEEVVCMVWGSGG